MFAHLSSSGKTARSFGGLRMTVKWEGVIPGLLLFIPRGLPPINVILRPPKDLAVRLPAQEVVLSKKDTMD
jgi:hypothetical protein